MEYSYWVPDKTFKHISVPKNKIIQYAEWGIAFRRGK